MKILSLVIKLFLFVSPTFGVIHNQTVQNDQNVTQFSINEGHLIQIPNHHRKDSTLKLSFRPAAVEKISKTNATSWKLTLNDKSLAEINVLNSLNFTEYNLIWHGSTQENENREICVHYGFNQASWYSGYQSNDSHWPMDTRKFLNHSQFNYVFELASNSHPFYYHREFEFILEHLWVNTDGFSLTLDPRQPLFVRRDPNGADPVMCFSVYIKENLGQFDERFYLRNVSDPTYRDIKLRLLAGSNIRTVTDYFGSKFITKPSAIPDTRFFRYPTFYTHSTHAQALATDIISNGFSNQSQLLFTNFGWINYTHSNGVDKNFSDLSTSLHSKGFGVGIELGRPDLKNARTREPEKHLTEPDRYGDELDLTLPEAVKYYQDSVRRIQKDYKFDFFLLRSFILDNLQYNDTEYRRYPNMFANKYSEAASHAFSSNPNVTIISEFAFKTQHLPVITRMLNYFSVPNRQLLHELIPNVLSLSIAGYSYIQPYSIGGFDWAVKPTDEEMIRFVQATALLPSMSFTRFPWDFSSNVLSITKKFVDLHTAHASTIVQLAQNRVQTGQPIVRPLWYLDPENTKTYKIGDQFMLGNDILVAPVVVLGQRERNVYLPTGSWIDQHGKVYQGPGEFKVAAPLEELPYFKRKI